MTEPEALAVFLGVPALVVLLVALPIFGPVWLERLRARRDEDQDE